uniref:Band 7 domain-containing protein n=1 Tax=Meloidogyne incognita TaxID=6306 RepID=A0A914L5X6_MELIC
MEVNEEEIPEGGGGLRLRGGNLDNNSPQNANEFTDESLRRGNVPIIFTSQQQQSTSYRTASSVIVDRRRIQHVRIQLEGTCGSNPDESSSLLSSGTSSRCSSPPHASFAAGNSQNPKEVEEEEHQIIAGERVPLMQQSHFLTPESSHQQQQQMTGSGGGSPSYFLTPSALNTPRHSQSGGRPRMGRRFTLNPLIFAKEEREMRRQSLAQLKLSYYPKGPGDYDGDTSSWLCQWGFWFLGWLIVLATFPVSVCFCLKVVKEYERAVIFRLGRLIGGGSKGPGIFWVMPCIESYVRVDLRTVSFSVPPQEILTRDSVTVSVDAVVYYRIMNATVSVANVENAHHSTRLLAQTTMRNMLGIKTLAEILSDRDSIALTMQTLLDEATDSWGIKVERVEIKDVRLPLQLQRAMAAEAEATREARAKVIAAEGEQRASNSLKEAATMLADSPAALQLRFLQTLNSVAAEKNSTIIVPIPVEIIRHFLSR